MGRRCEVGVSQEIALGLRGQLRVALLHEDRVGEEGTVCG